MRRFPLLFMLLSAQVLASDWPMWRCDAGRRAASPAELPATLHLQWTRKLPPVQMAWPNEARLHFDASYEPVAMGKTLFLGSPNDGSVRAFDADTGEQRWRVYTEGPVRFAPVAWRGRVYVGSDGGWLYCLDAASGALRWKVRGAPNERDDWRHLGNRRLISFWPVRGGPVLADGTLYFAAGIWPTLGVFIRAVDAETGKTLWTNASSHYLEQVRLDHNELHEAGLSPQGYLVVTGDKLLVPNGRSMPARFDRRTGKLLYYVQGYRNGDCRVTAMGQYAFVGQGGVVDIQTGREVGSRWAAAGKNAPNKFDGRKFDLFEGPIHPYKLFPACDWRSALDGGTAYGLHWGRLFAYDVQRARLSLYSKEFQGHKLSPARWDAPKLWQLDTPRAGKWLPSDSLIKAGRRLYGHVGKTLLAFDLPAADGKPSLAWEKAIDGTPSSLIAAAGKLFVATREGGLYCFGAQKVEPRRHPLPSPPPAAPADAWTRRAARLLERAGVAEGYGVLLGLGSGRLLDELLRQSKLHLIAVDPDAAKVNATRDRLVATGAYGERAEVLVRDPRTFRFPQYLASLVAWETPDMADLPPERLKQILRPYGGVACVPRTAPGRPASEDDYTLLRRDGPLPGSASWTHETADPARSYCSHDERVKAPLGVLWYGDGPGHGFHKRKDYGVGVKPQVVGGRLFALQLASRTLHAVDVYTGRALWQASVPAFTRYASLPDGIYAAGGDACVVYEPATGNVTATLKYKVHGMPEPQVADIRVTDSIVLIAAAPTKVRRIEEGLWDSSVLIALDRKTGRPLWTRRARARFNNNALACGAGLVFCTESLSPVETQASTRRGESGEPLDSTVVALDARTGAPKWQAVTRITHRTRSLGSWLAIRGHDDWLAYAARPGLLISGKMGQVHAFDAVTGQERWHKAIGGGQPIIIRRETFFSQSGHLFDLATGELLRGASLFRRGGCNYAVGNQALIFLRDRTASYVDVATAKKYYLRNVRSGCSNSMVAADGVLSVPCFAVGCICNYPIQTSFAMVHFPATAPWSGDTPLNLRDAAPK